MKWYFDTHRFMSEKMRTALQIIVSSGINTGSNQREIVEVAKKLEDAKVYDRGKASDRIRRALFTYLKAYDLLDKNDQLTEIGRLFAEGKISVKEMCFIHSVNYCYPKNEEKAHHYYPLHHILFCLKKLNEQTDTHNYISIYDFLRIAECDSTDDFTELFISDLINHDSQNDNEIDGRKIGYDVWSYMLNEAGIFERSANKRLTIKNNDLVEWLLKAYENDCNTVAGELATGVLKYLPTPTLKETVGSADIFLEEGRALQAYLFDDIDNQIIAKYICTSTNNDYMKNMLDSLGLGLDSTPHNRLDTSNKEFYSTFKEWPHVVGWCLSQNTDQRIKIIGSILMSLDITYDELVLPNTENHEVYDDVDRVKGGTNIILYGVPGAGKSWTIKNYYCNDENLMERLVFHPDYTYSDFVGQILPKIADDGTVNYEFMPGPFTNLLRKAYINPDKMFYLIIEEINRGNAPAIFGDIFQLLDRDKNGKSEYEITNADIAKKVYMDGNHKVSIPSNMCILCTMNTSDQNVFTLDTAFQRRWSMRLIKNKFSNEASERQFAEMKILDTDVTWEKFFTEINSFILGKNIRMTSSEDKRLGTHFVSIDDLAEGTGDDPKQIERQNSRFPEKVLKYLWDDAFKFTKEDVFDLEKVKSLEDVIDLFVSSSRNERFRVFKENIYNALVPKNNS